MLTTLAAMPVRAECFDRASCVGQNAENSVRLTQWATETIAALPTATERPTRTPKPITITPTNTATITPTSSPTVTGTPQPIATATSAPTIAPPVQKNEVVPTSILNISWRLLVGAIGLVVFVWSMARVRRVL